MTVARVVAHRGDERKGVALGALAGDDGDGGKGRVDERLERRRRVFASFEVHSNLEKGSAT